MSTATITSPAIAEPVTSLPSWEYLLETARKYTDARRIRRIGQHPSTQPIPSSWDNLPASGIAPVLLYRDSNSWCPFCERVWFALEEKGIPFTTEFINLSDKPKWYTDLVPTTLVPAVKIEGELVYESKDILLALEKRFPEVPLLPSNPEERAVADRWIEESETNGFRDLAYQLLRNAPEDPQELEELRAKFEAQLDILEANLGKYPSPFFLSEFSIVDILYSPHLDRLAANLPVYRGYHLKGNPRFPRINAWFEAIAQRPAYQRSASDNTTNNLLLRRRFGIDPVGNPAPLNADRANLLANRAEAAERLSDNHELAIGDVLKNSGVAALAIDNNLEAVQEIVDRHLRFLANYLLYGNGEILAGGNTGGKEGTGTPEAAIGAITFAYLRNRLCAPRDLSAGAATAIRFAIDKVLASLY